MEDDTSNDVEAVEYIDSQDEEDPDGGEKRPIMLLLRRLIRNKQNTVMTNAQIIDILESEFNICVKSSHELEVDIYIKIIKKYLKDWPQWEELERISTKLSHIKDFDAVTKVLNHKYKNLKEYLGVMLEAAKPLANEAVKGITPEGVKNDEVDSSDVVMEIQCTRTQLNHLFFRRPRIDLNNTVFNMSKVVPSRISLKNLSFEEIIRGCWLTVHLILPHFLYVRTVMYKLKHVLVNKVRNENFTDTSCLQTDLQIQLNKKSIHTYNKDLLIKQFDDILAEWQAWNNKIYEVIHSIFNILVSEIKDMELDVVKVPANYRRYTSKYKYVKYLYAENELNVDPRYDLQLEETLSPMYHYYIGKIGKLQKPFPEMSTWLKIECMFCKIILPGAIENLKEIVETHFNELHHDETDWQCTNCKQMFSIDFLANNKWCHEC